jgi:molecular chaperone DnaK (HSP70)
MSHLFDLQVVGLAAKSGLARNGPSTVIHNKKLLNEKIEECELEEAVNAISCKVIHEEGTIKYEIKRGEKLYNFTPEDVAVCIYKKMYGKQLFLIIRSLLSRNVLSPQIVPVLSV